MASEKKEAAGWGFRLVAILITLIVLVGVYGFSLSNTGDDFGSVVRAAIPFGSAVIVSYALGRINKISHKRWQIYLIVLLMVAVYISLRIARIL